MVSATLTLVSLTGVRSTERGEARFSRSTAVALTVLTKAATAASVYFIVKIVMIVEVDAARVRETSDSERMFCWLMVLEDERSNERQNETDILISFTHGIKPAIGSRFAILLLAVEG